MASKKNSKEHLVVCKHPEKYQIFDDRIMKPICAKQIKNGVETGSMVYHELDIVDFPKNPLRYFPPNNVAILLSIAKKGLTKAEILYSEKIDPKIIDHSLFNTKENKNEFIQNKSSLVADFIELIQTSIVFSYTALEAFANLSIPEDYEYESEVNNKGILEIYNKKAIERWLPLKTKIANILPVIYETKNIEKQNFWPHFIDLEKCRHDIIHQKSILRTEFYKVYFRKDIFTTCKSAEDIITFFSETYSTKNVTHALWPWTVNKNREFPLEIIPDGEKFEIIGNIYEGVKK